MADINSNLNNLFKNYQQQQNYKKKAFDVNGDGKINSKDKNELSKTEKNLLKDKTLFDFNGDGKFTQADVDMFVKGDFNGDGVQSADELNFISTYEKELVADFKKAKADFEIGGVKYIKGKTASGIYDGKYYKSGKLGTGLYKNIYYSNGVPANGVVKNVLYQNGVEFTGVNEEDGLYYKNGKVASGKVTDGNTTANYKKGVLQYSITDNNGKDYPKVSGQNIQCKNGKKTVNIKLQIGEVAVINADGTIDITGKDGKVKQYSSDGNLLANAVKKNLDGLLTNYENLQLYNTYGSSSSKQKKAPKEILEQLDVNADGKVDSNDKNLINANIQTILKESMLFDIDGDKKLSQADIDKFLEGDIDGDGKTSDIEKSFVKEYKDDLKTAFTNAKADFNLDNKQYFDGTIAKGVEKDGLHYTNGAKTNGDVNNQLYIDGAKSNLTGEYEGNGKYYVNGIAANGLQENGFHYTNGNKTNGVATENGEKYFYKGGVKGAGQAAGDEKNQVFVYDEDGKYHHSVKGFWIKANGDYKRTYVENPSDRCSEPNKLFFKSGDQETHFIDIKKGDEIRILDSGKFFITRDGIQYSYDEVGNIIEIKQVGTSQGGVNPPYIDGVPPANSSDSTGSTGGTTGTGGTTPSNPSNGTSVDLPEGITQMSPPKNILAPGAVGSVEYISDVIGRQVTEENFTITKDSAGRIIKLESKHGDETFFFEYKTNPETKADEISKIKQEVVNSLNSTYTKTCTYENNEIKQETEILSEKKGDYTYTKTKKINCDGKLDNHDYVRLVITPPNTYTESQITKTNYGDGRTTVDYYGKIADGYKGNQKTIVWQNGILQYELKFEYKHGNIRDQDSEYYSKTTNEIYPILKFGNRSLWELKETEENNN